MTFVPALTRKMQKGTSGPAGDEHHHLFVVSATLGSPRGHDEQATYVTSNLFGEDAHQRGFIAGRKIAHSEALAHDGAELVGVASDFDGGEDHVSDLVGADVGAVGNLNVEVDKNGHGSSNRDGDTPSIPQAGAGRNGWDGDTSSPERSAPVGVRRLTPRECERLQALPDNWTNPTGDAPDSRRYAALGDAVTSSVAEWIGRRLQ